MLAGEAEIPFALVGYATDYANGVQPEPTPVARLLELIAASADAFATLLGAALPLIDVAALAPAGVMYRFHEESAAPSALVIARAPGADGVLAGLEPLLDAPRRAALQALLIAARQRGRRPSAARTRRRPSRSSRRWRRCCPPG